MGVLQIEALPTRSNDEQPLQNILSISTAGRNRYLLHFNSHHSLIQWTAGIRLAMYEHSTLQEAYTGALIAGKGKTLNNINLIMDRTRFKTEEWVRVRFGAGVPWRRCWCVISPPDEKEFQKAQKEMKKRSPYDRSHAPLMKGDIKFYDSKKEAEKKKKARAIASITEAYSAYAIYPQSRALIDGSTLLKVEGSITIHSDPPSATEGFVFIMPETHPAVSGCEMMLRFLFPTWDTFNLYGRPGRLVASVLDPRSLMFAMPKHKRYGYLEILDVATLILTDGSAGWTERDWRKQLKELTGRRMTAMEDGTKTHGRSTSRSSKRLSFGPQNTGPARPRVGFADDSVSVRSSRSMTLGPHGLRTDSAPPDPNRERAPSALGGSVLQHGRNSSDTGVRDAGAVMPDFGPPVHGRASPPGRVKTFASDLASTPERVSSDDERAVGPQELDIEPAQRMETPEPVNAPPSFSHGAGAKPNHKPFHSPEMRRANSRLSSTTLSQLAKAGGLTPDLFADNDMGRQLGEDGINSDPRGPSVQPQTYANSEGMMNANYNGSREALTPVTNIPSGPPRSSPGLPPPDMGLAQKQSKSPLAGPGPPMNHGPGPNTGRPPNNYNNPNNNNNNYRGPGPGQMGPPPPHGRGQPPMMMMGGQRGPPPPGQGNYPPRDPRMGPQRPPGPPGSPGPGGPNPYQNYRGPPPPGPRRTPPPNGAMRGPPPHTQTSPPINRKPLPHRTTSLQRGDGPGAASPSTDYPPTHAASHAPNTIQQQQGFAGLRRQDSERSRGSSSHYDDAASNVSPDYASTRKSTDTQESVERPRAGVLRTIGDPAASQPPVPRLEHSDYNVPNINFGPTVMSSAPRNRSPARPGTAGGLAPAAHLRQESDDTIRRNIPWQPGVATAGSPSSPDRALTPEQFVQQRAAAAGAPRYAHGHQRSQSGNTLGAAAFGNGSGRPTSPQPPPMHSRNSSVDLLQRPSSRGSGMVLSGGEVSSHLSAREQEHVARVTGTPLIHVAGGRNGQQPQAGLVGAIDARERERAQMKQGLGGQAVAQAIDQRQREQYQAQRAAQAAYAQQMSGQQQHQNMIPGPEASAYGAPSMGPMGMGMGPGPVMSPPRQQRSQMVSPQGSYNNGNPANYGPQGGQGYGPGGDWQQRQQQRSPPPQGHPQGMPGMGMGMRGYRPQSPAAMPPPGQLPPQQARPNTPGGMPFQGQAF